MRSPKKLPIDISIGIGAGVSSTPFVAASQTATNSGVGILQANWAAKWGAQEFQPSQSGTLVSVDLMLSKPVSATMTGTFTIGIQQDSGGVPSGTDIAAGTHNLSILPEGNQSTFTTYALNDFAPGDINWAFTYWIVFKSGFTNSPIELVSSPVQTPSIIAEEFRQSTNSGTSWPTPLDQDIVFRVNATS